MILGNNPKLLYVNCAHNALAQLDLSSCVDLQELNCVSNPLQFLRLSSNLDYRMHEHFRYDAGTPLYWE